MTAESTDSTPANLLAINNNASQMPFSPNFSALIIESFTA